MAAAGEESQRPVAALPNSCWAAAPDAALATRRSLTSPQGQKATMYAAGTVNYYCIDKAGNKVGAELHVKVSRCAHDVRTQVV